MKRTLISLLAMALFATAAHAGTIYNWTGATSNNLDVAGNWLVGGSVPAAAPTNSNNQPSTPAIDDSLVFDSTTWTRAPRELYTRTNRKWGSIVVNDGTVNGKNDGNNQGNYSWSGTDTVVVGDGDATAAALNLNITNWNQGGTTGTKTYVVNSDGTLASNRGGTHNWSNGADYDTVMEIIGGAVNINGILKEAQLTGDDGDYVSFEALSSTFTFNKGSAGDQFDVATDITDHFGSSFRLGGSLNSGNAALELTDGDTTWTITVKEAAPDTDPNNPVPEPATLALLSLAACGLGGYVRRRKAT